MAGHSASPCRSNARHSPVARSRSGGKVLHPRYPDLADCLVFWQSRGSRCKLRGQSYQPSSSLRTTRDHDGSTKHALPPSLTDASPSSDGNDAISPSSLRGLADLSARPACEGSVCPKAAQAAHFSRRGLPEQCLHSEFNHRLLHNAFNRQIPIQ